MVLLSGPIWVDRIVEVILVLVAGFVVYETLTAVGDWRARREVRRSGQPASAAQPSARTVRPANER